MGPDWLHGIEFLGTLRNVFPEIKVKVHKWASNYLPLGVGRWDWRFGFGLWKVNSQPSPSGVNPRKVRVPSTTLAPHPFIKNPFCNEFLGIQIHASK